MLACLRLKTKLFDKCKHYCPFNLFWFIGKSCLSQYGCTILLRHFHAIYC